VEPKNRYSDTHLTIDKRIPLVFIIGLILQAVGFVWYVSYFASSTDNRLMTLEDFRRNQTEQYKFLPEKITKLEVQQQYTNDMLKQILSEIKQNQRDLAEQRERTSLRDERTRNYKSGVFPQ